jgi:hypothetical protein
MFALVFPAYIGALMSLATSHVNLRVNAMLMLSALLLANTHNMGMILLTASALPFAWLLWSQRNVRKVLMLGSALIAAGLSWIATRHAFQLEGSHEFHGLFGAERSLASAAMDLIKGPSDLLCAVWPLGLLTVALAIASVLARDTQTAQPQRALARTLLATVLLFDGLLFVLFTSIDIEAGIQGRFSLFPTLMLLVFCLHGRAGLPQLAQRAFVLLMCLTVASSGMRLAKWQREHNFSHVHQWNRSVIESSKQFDHDAIRYLRSHRCADITCKMP